MCIPVSQKKVAASWGTVFDTSTNSDATSWCGTAGKMGRRRPSAIKLLHSLAWRTMKPTPHAMVANSQSRRVLSFPRAAALTARTMVSELVNRHAVMIVALTILQEWNGDGQFEIEMRPDL